MVRAFVMIKTGTGESEGLIENIRGLAHITEAHIVAGAYDVIAEVESEEVYDVLEAASTKVQGLEGVIETKTYISLDS